MPNLPVALVPGHTGVQSNEELRRNILGVTLERVIDNLMRPPSEALIDPLARQLRESNLVVGPVLQTMLGSNLFFSRHAVGRKVRSPVELGIGLLRAALACYAEMATFEEAGVARRQP